MSNKSWTVEVEQAPDGEYFIQLTDENERVAAYEKLIGKWKFFRSYAKRAGRVIPVFRLKIESNANL